MLENDLQEAAGLLQAGHHQQALDVLAALKAMGSESADYWQLLALAHKGLGQLGEAEASYLKSLELNSQSHVITNLANLYRQQGRLDEAENRYKEALHAESKNVPALINYGQLLMDGKRFEAAADRFSVALECRPGHVNARIGLGQALQHLGDQQGAVGLFQDVLSDNADNAAALNGLGISLKTMGYADEAVLTLQRAHELAPNSADVLLNLASALALADRSEEAVAAYEAMLVQEPDNPEFHHYFNGYLGVIGHPDYLETYRQALQRNPADAEFAVPLARKLLLEGRGEEALDVLFRSLEVGGEVERLNREISYVQREQGQFKQALEHAMAARDKNPNPASERELATVLMAAGADYEEALTLLRSLVERFPEDQGLWALFATALRYVGCEDEYHVLVDYDKMIQVREIATPEKFDTRDEGLAFFRESLLRLHTTQRHPVEQSMVYGTQTLDDLFSRRDSAIQQLTEVLGDQILAVLSAMPQSDSHPLYRRNTRRFRFSDSWSVRLWRDGFHKNHFHSQGWLSSAFYLTVPDAVDHGGEGWIKFGEPGFNARASLSADYWVKPKEGSLVVFPSYLWHGTEPLKTASERVTVGYDILPAARIQE